MPAIPIPTISRGSRRLSRSQSHRPSHSAALHCAFVVGTAGAPESFRGVKSEPSLVRMPPYRIKLAASAHRLLLLAHFDSVVGLFLGMLGGSTDATRQASRMDMLQQKTISDT